MARWIAGDVVVEALLDGSGSFFARVADAFPGANIDGEWLLDFRCYALRLPDGRTIMIDAGIGPIGSVAAGWAPVPGKLPERIAEICLAPEDVDVVVLTHLHTDHVGWAVLDDVPYFPNARYVVQRVEYDVIRDANVVGRVLQPLAASGQLHLVDGRIVLAPGVEAFPTPGHTPGHQSVLVSADGAELLLTGDVLVHAIQLADPAVTYRYESEPDQARTTRVNLLAAARQRGAILATPHLRKTIITDW